MIIAGLYGLLMIPLPEKEWEPPKAQGTPFIWNRDALWSDLEKTFNEGKAMQPEKLDSLVRYMSRELDSVLDEHEGKRISPEESLYPLLNNMFFRIAPMIAAQQNKSRMRQKLRSNTTSA